MGKQETTKNTTATLGESSPSHAEVSDSGFLRGERSYRFEARRLCACGLVDEPRPVGRGERREAGGVDHSGTEVW
ncbi:hypothetical protein UG55_101218 [Frankia sp. EI5c]|nr:hypothetical protein UG55_101218 [Frankia sp. EI5c]